MHKLLERQLRRHFGSLDEVPSGLRGFLEMVDEAYAAADEDRSLVERSLELTSQELLDRNAELKQDIAERLQAEERLKSAYRRLEELDRFRTQFINNTAHELATPLTPILLQIHLLRKEQSAIPPPMQRSLELLERNVERLGQLVSDVLDASRLQAKRLKLKRAPTDLGSLVQDCVASYRELAKKGDVALRSAVDGPLVVTGDPGRLNQVLFNLLSNAFKFTPPHGEVRVTARTVAGEAVVEVRDTGLGIAAENLPKLFQPFSQVHDTMQLQKAGTGLGLYVSRGIVAEHGGALECRSDGVGQGACFVLRLPLATTGTASGEALASNGREAAESAAA